MPSGAMRSLFRSGIRSLRSRFANETADDELPTPLGLRVGAAVDVDTLPLRMYADDSVPRRHEEAAMS